MERIAFYTKFIYLCQVNTKVKYSKEEVIKNGRKVEMINTKKIRKAFWEYITVFKN